MKLRRFSRSSDVTAPPVQARGAGFSSAVRSRGRHIKLASKDHRAVRFLSGAKISLAEGETESWITLTRTGEFFDDRYGEFEITSQMLDQMVENYDADVLGVKVFVDVQHRPDQGAAAEVMKLRREGVRLRALAQWTPYGVDAVRRKKMIYLSAEYHEDWRDNEQRKRHGATLLGAGLTTRPVVSRLDPVELSDLHLSPDSIPDGPTLLHPELVRQLSHDWSAKMDKHLKALRKRLSELGLGEEAINSICESYKLAAGNLGDDDAKLKALAEQFGKTGEQLAKAKPGEKVTLSIEGLPKAGGEGEDKTPNAEDIDKLIEKKLAAARKAEEDEKKKLAQDLESRQKLFRDTVEAAEGLPDDAKKALCKQCEDLITGNMSEDQIKRLAEYQVSQANELEAAKQLAALGYKDSRGGTPRITVNDASEVKKLTSEIRDHLRKTSKARSGEIRLPEKEPEFVSIVLAEFDREHARELAQERKVLAGEMDTTRTQLPVSFQREVIREALSDLRVLDLVQTITDFGGGGTMDIPYEERDDPSLVVNDGIVFEGKGIPFHGIQQKMDTAYVLPMKLAMKATNEVLHFTSMSGLNWDSWGRNLASNAQIMRELLARRICNMLQRVSDSVGATEAAAENIAAQLDGSNDVVTLAQFPMVRPFQQYDKRGNTVGAPETPAVGDFNGTPVTQWDGTGDQAAGTYWRPYNLNLGQIQFVDKDGNPVTPTEATATFSYWYATNVGKFDLDFDSGETSLEKHLNGAHRAIGRRKAILQQERFVMADYMLMAHTLNDELTNAEQHSARGKRDGSDTTATGDLENIKGLPAFSTNAPNVDLGEERVIIGRRGQLTYGVNKPWQLEGAVFEAVDSNGRPTGEKVHYAEEYNAIHVPKPIRNRMTSVLIYSGAARA